MLAKLMQYKRVFTTHRFQLWVNAFIVVSVGYSFAIVMAAIFVCWPIRTYWALTKVDGWCMNTTASWFFNAAMNILTDLAVIILPMPVIRSLQLAPRQKWLLMGVFAVGLV